MGTKKVSGDSHQVVNDAEGSGYSDDDNQETGCWLPISYEEGESDRDELIYRGVETERKSFGLKSHGEKNETNPGSSP